METAHLIFIFLGFTASIVSAIFGLGMALIVLAVGSYILPIKEVIVLATVLFTASNITKTVLFKKYIDWKITAIMGLASFPFAYFGASVLVDVPSDILRRLLGAMVLIYLGLVIFKTSPKFKIGSLALIFGSAAYGFVSGLLGSGNLIKVIIFREMNITKEAFVGVMAATTILTNTAKLTAYHQSGLTNDNMLWPIVGLIIGAIAAALIGRFILRDLSSSQFELGVRIILPLLHRCRMCLRLPAQNGR